jgi:hypothetical protein
MDRNNHTNVHTVHGNEKPKNWELALGYELVGVIVP